MLPDKRTPGERLILCMFWRIEFSRKLVASLIATFMVPNPSTLLRVPRWDYARTWSCWCASARLKAALPGAGPDQLQEMALSGLGAQMGSECIPDKSLRVICLISFL